jgi:hypothetical protein
LGEKDYPDDEADDGKQDRHAEPPPDQGVALAARESDWLPETRPPGALVDEPEVLVDLFLDLGG